MTKRTLLSLWLLRDRRGHSGVAAVVAQHRLDRTPSSPPAPFVSPTAISTALAVACRRRATDPVTGHNAKRTFPVAHWVGQGWAACSAVPKTLAATVSAATAR